MRGLNPKGPQVVLQFGSFELDEAARELRLRGQPLDLQPKVFDLLTYFVRNAGRIIPKDELLDKLWPGVHVSESSLQRAVSLLRQALREGDLGESLKSFAGRGYRFAFDQPDLTSLLPGASGARASASGARAAASTRDWAKTLEALSARDPGGLSAGDLELWAYALECIGRPGEAIPLLRSAVDRREAEGQLEQAAADAATLAKIHFERAEAAVARGWLARAASHLDTGPSEPRAYLVWMQARVKAFEGLPEQALELAQEALATAEACGSVRLRALTMCSVGFYNLSLGQTRAGLEQQDHAAALAMSNAVDPITGGLIYCNILWACRTHADWPRASQWQEGYEIWCEENLAGIGAACQLHRAEAMAVQGTLAEALERMSDAIARLPIAEPWAIGDAHRVRGDIHAAAGDLVAARRDYERAYDMGWDAEPGNALLLFDAGDVDGALAALNRVLANNSWFGLQRRGWILAHKARLCALAARSEEAHACLQALAARFDDWPSQATRALAQEAEAVLALNRGQEHPSPVQLFNLARQIWTSVNAEYQAARVRLALARVMRASGDRAGALVEVKCCESAARRIGAKTLREEALALLETLDLAD